MTMALKCGLDFGLGHVSIREDNQTKPSLMVFWKYGYFTSSCLE